MCSFRKLWIVLLGYSILATGCLFFFIPSLPEVLQSVHLATGINLDDHLLNDKAAGIYNTFFYLGSIIGPPLGGVMKDWIGYRSTNDVMAIFSRVLQWLTLSSTWCSTPTMMVSG